MNNQRGGIISSIFIIPIGIALMVGFFFLGYYVGKYQSKTNQNEIVVPLPDVVSKNLPKKEDFTFYKTLTDRGDKTVSIDLKPEKKQADAEKKAEAEQEKKKPEPKKDKKPELKPEKSVVVKEPETKQQAVKKEPQTAKKEPVAKKEPKVRYTLQIASYQEKSMADEDVKTLKQKGYAAFIQGTEIEGKGTWYRVRLGSFSNKASAEKLQKELQAKVGVAPFVTIE